MNERSGAESVVDSAAVEANGQIIIENPWSEGDPNMKETAGEQFSGKALWGNAPSTWIKFAAPGGVIVIPREGSPRAAFNTPAMPWAMID